MPRSWRLVPRTRALDVLRSHFTEVLALSSGCAALAALIYAVARRVRHPYELEWMEGGMVDHVGRLLAGRPLYAAPSIEFTAYIYNPLFYWLAVPVAGLIGLSYSALRIVSVVSLLVLMGLLWFLVARETRTKRAAFAATACFSATYALSSGWLDLARVDTTALVFVLAAFAAVRHGGAHGEWFGTGVFLCLAYLSKQSALLYAPGAALFLLVSRGWTRALWLTLWTTALVAGATLALDWSSGGWYRYYAFQLPAGHATMDPLAAWFWRGELFGPLAIAAAVSLFGVLVPASRASRWFAVAFLLPSLVIAWLTRIHTGSFANDVIPGHLGLCFGFGLGLARVRELRPVGAGRHLAACMLALQLALLAYDPRVFVPKKSDRLEGDRFVAELRETPGEVLVAYRGHLPTLAGKGSAAHQMAVLDVLRAEHDPRGAKLELRREYERAFAQHRFALVVLDEQDFPFMRELRAHYVERPLRYAKDPKAFVTRSGSPMKPRWAYVPRT